MIFQSIFESNLLFVCFLFTSRNFGHVEYSQPKLPADDPIVDSRGVLKSVEVAHTALIQIQVVRRK